MSALVGCVSIDSGVSAYGVCAEAGDLVARDLGDDGAGVDGVGGEALGGIAVVKFLLVG